MSDEPQTWVSVIGVAWVLDSAPVPTELALTLLAIARRADANGRGARPAVATIAKNTGKSADQTQRDITKLRALGLLVLGDQNLVAHLPARHRPVVYDLPLERAGDKPARTSKNASGLRSGMEAGPCMDAGTGMDAGSRSGIHAVPRSGMDAVQKKTLNKTNEKDSSSSARSATLAYLCGRLGVDDDDGIWLINEIKIRHRPASIGAYVRSMDDDDFRELLDDRKADRDAADANDDGLEPKDVPWCGKCGPNRLVDVLDDRGLVRAAAWCETCSPNRKRKPRPGVPKKSGYQPYRNPTDPNAYLGGWNAERDDRDYTVGSL